MTSTLKTTPLEFDLWKKEFQVLPTNELKRQ